VHYAAGVTTSASGAITPAGTVSFFDAGTAINNCTRLSIASGQAVCTVTYAKAGTHVITARYAGDGNFAASDSAAGKTVVLPSTGSVRPSVTSTMKWSFLRTKAYTEVMSLVISHPPAGGAVLMKCSGHGCPFASRTIPVPSHTRCTSGRKRHCTSHAVATLDITSQFRNAKLAPGTTLVIEVTRKGYNGRYYRFNLSAKGQQSQIACIAPHHVKPNQGCKPS
jgi:hypothetical protein